eukprot:7321770-Alexandrium_andersonii.AAC.1
MSASLVGSEMCIRDSAHAQAHANVHEDMRTRTRPPTRALRQKQRVHRATPVSYTHLTLPTICSV